MTKFYVFLVLCVASCYAAAGAGTFCGEIPSAVYRCITLPTLTTREVSHKCSEANDECEKITCISRKMKWLDGSSVDKAKLTTFFEQFAKDHDEWAPAVQQVKTVCLGSELKAQGVFLNCPVYDVMHCILGTFIKHATPSQWSTDASCSYARAYASDCPVCPNDCFSPQVPIGSCNACYLQPPAA